MDNYLLVNFFIFFVILFFYIHVYNNIKTSNYLEVYEFDHLSKDKLEEYCGLKQPLLLNTENLLNIDINLLQNNYNGFEIKVLNKETNDISLPIKLGVAIELFDRDTSSNYISENNMDFLNETSVEKEYSANDLILRPSNTSFIQYDLIIGSLNSYTLFKYSLSCRNYFMVLSGSIEVTMTPPKNSRYLYVKKNYEDLLFYSSIDINNVKDAYKNDFDKIKLLRITLSRDKLLFIPPYWFYSIKILEKNTLVANYQYRSFMNSVAILPELSMQFLQKNNVKANITKVVKTCGKNIQETNNYQNTNNSENNDLR